MNSLLVCGGAGFIGSHFVKLVKEKYPDCRIGVLDAFTYAGNGANLDPDVYTYKASIQDFDHLDSLFGGGRHPQYIVNFAAQTHNDRSMLDSRSFIDSNTVGPAVLCDIVKKYGVEKFVHVSTDEVYGSIANGEFTENSPIQPRTPYSASKAGGDLQCLAHHLAFDTPVCITRGGNTYGPNQYPEKLIPFFISRLLDYKKVPMYGDGMAIREWIHVKDHAEGILAVLEKGIPGQVYNIGDNNERYNFEVVSQLCELLGRDYVKLVKFVEDPRKKSHDMRYSMNTLKAFDDLGWYPKIDFETGLKETVQWYAENREWWQSIASKPEYTDFIEKYYKPLLGEDF